MNNKLKILLIIVASALLIYGFKRTNDHLFEISKNLSIFSSVYKEIDLNYVDEVKPGELMKTGIDAMLGSLDPYTNYIPESSMEDFRIMTTGEYGGIGTLISKRKDFVLITEVYEGFGAHQAGLMAGDKVYKVDGVNINSKSNDEVSEALKGQAGTFVILTIQRDGEEKMREIKIERQKIKINEVPYYGVVEGKVGYIKLTSFTFDCAQAVKNALVELKSKHQIESLVLDLRGNGGGVLGEAVNIVNLFVPKGTKIVETKGRIKESNFVYKTQFNSVDETIPLVVLVDEFSASASEIVAGAIQDLDRGIVVGETTYGKGLVQQTRDLDYNTKIKFTVAKYYTPSGRCIQKLDYSNKENGRATIFADSTLSKFKTKNGREVIDGRGVEPDIKVDPGFYSNLTASVVTNDVVFDFATKYRLKNTQIASAKDFVFSDGDYIEFKKFALSKEFEYKTATEETYKKLLEVAEKEKYFSEEEFTALHNKIKPNKEEDLLRYKNELIEILESEIASRYYYQKGRVEVSFKRDPFIKSAFETLANKELYNNTLMPK
ncbi:MAG: S41 family peptidase [Bacteroidia bacterium]